MLQFIKQQISEHTQEKEKKIVQYLEQSQFSLYEDLLILEIMLNEKLTYQHFEQLSLKCHKKTPDELKLRYINCIKKLTEEDLKQIIEFIKNNGLEGILFYDKKGLQICKINEEIKNKKDITQTKKEIKHSVEPQLKKKIRIQPEVQPQPQNYYQLTDLQKHILYSANPTYQEQRFPTNPNYQQSQRLKQEQFQNALHDLSIWYDIPFEKMILLLKACSGSFHNLKQFLEDRNYFIYWKPEEDQKLKTKEEIQSLYLTKGVLEVEKRKQWLQCD
ncbi:unnamed protein product (macronuclear) [Paramecium tetraurelia]|uniref:Myb-like domain-containing protein n=1 Tax=Paramecium tetraurelia TaxID=5888 RepID=A0CNA7_PARTE|nr:uncharacterized protein GSPATT00008715001 [Paramecium tetraurelia]CAK72274.1 unnamed protein product [Paramecium tetraurelia]|eukprot:XP_001439671.1 hypothetical protein (macronuclear) [Paramecium tetraurelia strain d4-2]